MANDNQVSAALTDANITDILAALTTIETLLPFVISRAPGDNNVMLGEKSVGFDEKCAAYMASNPEFIPGYVDPAEVLKDRALRVQFNQFLPRLNLLAAKAQDTYDVVGNEMMMADLAYYNSTGDASKRGKTSAGDIHTDLATRYPGRTTVKPRKLPPNRWLRKETRSFVGEMQPSPREKHPLARAFLPVERETLADAVPREAIKRAIDLVAETKRGRAPGQPRRLNRQPCPRGGHDQPSQPTNLPDEVTSLASRPPSEAFRPPSYLPGGFCFSVRGI